MILVDTSVMVAWLDPRHPDHAACTEALDGCAAVDELAISALTVAELAAGGRSREALFMDFAGLLLTSRSPFMLARHSPVIIRKKARAGPR